MREGGSEAAKMVAAKQLGYFFFGRQPSLYNSIGHVFLVLMALQRLQVGAAAGSREQQVRAIAGEPAGAGLSGGAAGPERRAAGPERRAAGQHTAERVQERPRRAGARRGAVRGDGVWAVVALARGAGDGALPRVRELLDHVADKALLVEGTAKIDNGGRAGGR